MRPEVPRKSFVKNSTRTGITNEKTTVSYEQRALRVLRLSLMKLCKSKKRLTFLSAELAGQIFIGLTT